MAHPTPFRRALVAAAAGATLLVATPPLSAQSSRSDSLADATLAYHLAREARAREDLIRADGLLDLTIGLDPDAPEPRMDRVEVLLGLARPSRAMGLLEPVAPAIEAESDRRPLTAARYHSLRGTVAIRTGDTATAIEAFERAAVLSPLDLAIRGQLIGLHRATGDPAGAIPHLEAASDALPDNAELKAELGDALVDLERYDEAVVAYEAALELAPGSSELRDRLERKIDRVRSAIER